MRLWKRVKGWRPFRPDPVPTLSLRRKPREIVCPCCKQTVGCWRRYANGKVECVACAEKP